MKAGYSYYNDRENETVYRIDEQTMVHGILLHGLRTMFEQRLTEDGNVNVTVYQGHYNCFTKKGEISRPYEKLDPLSRTIFEDLTGQKFEEERDKIKDRNDYYNEGKPDFKLFPSLDEIVEEMDKSF